MSLQKLAGLPSPTSPFHLQGGLLAPSAFWENRYDQTYAQRSRGRRAIRCRLVWLRRNRKATSRTVQRRAYRPCCQGSRAHELDHLLCQFCGASHDRGKYDESKSITERNDAAVAAAKALVVPSQRWRSLRVVKLSYPRTQPQGGVTGRDMHSAGNSFTPPGIDGVSRRNDCAGHPTARCGRFEVCCRRSSRFIHWRSSSTRRFLARPFSFVFDAIGAKKPTPDALRRCGSMLYSLTRAPTTSAARARDKSRLES